MMSLYRLTVTWDESHIGYPHGETYTSPRVDHKDIRALNLGHAFGMVNTIVRNMQLKGVDNIVINLQKGVDNDEPTE